MTRFFKMAGVMTTLLCCTLSANGQQVAQQKQDTLVVIVKHQNENGMFARAGKPFKKGYKAVETGVVKGYKAVEKGFVNGYQAIEDAVVDKFTDTESKSIYYKDDYRANIELSCLVPDSWQITTSHGRSFGNGLYVGGGVGFAAEFIPDYKSKPTYLVPLFADLKYSFINSAASPFVSLSAGGYADITNTGIRCFANPAIGIDIGRFAIKIGYEYQLGVWNHNQNVSKHSAKLGLSFNF